MNDDHLYTLEEAATYLGRTVWALRHHIYHTKRLPPDVAGQGKPLYFRRATLDAFARQAAKAGRGKIKPGNVAEVARRYGVTTSTVRAWCKAGLLSGAIKKKRYWHIPPEALIGWQPPGSVNYERHKAGNSLETRR